jgi:hypothetical protein
MDETILTGDMSVENTHTASGHESALIDRRWGDENQEWL